MLSDHPIASVIIVNWNHPDVIGRCLHSLAMTDGVKYEVVVVDNGSTPDVVDRLHGWQEEGLIRTLRCEPVNHYFSVGCNIGAAFANPASDYLVLLNSDVQILRPDWLTKMVAWMEDTQQVAPFAYTTRPTVITPGPRDIVSFGWAYDATVEGWARPDGFCLGFRRAAWRPISPDFPWHYGLEEMVCQAIRDGARCGVTCKYIPYIFHHGHGSWTEAPDVANLREPDMPGWFRGLHIETLDFTIVAGEVDHGSYLCW